MVSHIPVPLSLVSDPRFLFANNQSTSLKSVRVSTDGRVSPSKPLTIGTGDSTKRTVDVKLVTPTKKSNPKTNEAFTRASADGKRLGDHLLSPPMHPLNPSLLPIPFGRLSGSGALRDAAMAGGTSTQDRSSGARRSPLPSPGAPTTMMRYHHSTQQGGSPSLAHQKFPRKSTPSSVAFATAGGKRSPQGNPVNNAALLSADGAFDIEAQTGKRHGSVSRGGDDGDGEDRLAAGDSTRSLTGGAPSVRGSSRKGHASGGKQYLKKNRASHSGPTGGGEGEGPGTPKTVVAQCFQASPFPSCPSPVELSATWLASSQAADERQAPANPPAPNLPIDILWL